MSRKSVWIISKYATPNKYPRHFGIGKYLVSKGIHTTLFVSVSNGVAPTDVPSFKGWSKTEYHQGLKVVWMNGPSVSNRGLKRIFSWLWYEFKVISSNLFSKNKPDVILSSSLSLFSIWSGIVLSRRFNAMFSVEIRDIWPLSLVELGGYSKSNLLIRFLSYTEKLGYKRAEVIIGTMPNLVEHVMEVSPANAKKVTCIPQGGDLQIFEEKAERLSPQYIEKYIPEGKFVIAYTGTLNANNPIDSLFEAAEELAKLYPDIHFLILGEGVNKAHYQRMTEALNNVTFPPIIDKKQMAHFLSYVDVGYDAFSSHLGKYGLSRNKWIDYMYNECIIVCSYNGFQSMINEAESGFFVPYNDTPALISALYEVYAMSNEDRKTMKKRAKTYIKDNRTFDKLGKSYIRALDLT